MLHITIKISQNIRYGLISYFIHRVVTRKTYELEISCDFMPLIYWFLGIRKRKNKKNKKKIVQY